MITAGKTDKGGINTFPSKIIKRPEPPMPYKKTSNNESSNVIDNNPRLYIIMREDLYDNSPGKMMAQAAHAQADFDTHVENRYIDNDFRSAHIKWCEDRNFGTTLVLSATLNQMHEIRTNIVHSDITVDPTYPYRNWYNTVFTKEEPTCMWAFVYEENELGYMKQFKLHT